MFIHVAPTLSPKVFFKALFSRADSGFAFGRGMLIAALDSIRKNGKYPKVWLPAYICSSVPIFLKQHQIPYQFYHVNEDLGPDWDYLNKQNLAAGEVFLHVHYFGFSIAVEQTQDFCRKHNLILLKDCAHCLGQNGQLTIYSSRKLLPLPIKRSTIKMLLLWFLQKLGINWQIWKKPLNKAELNELERKADYPAKTSRWASRIKQALDISKVVETRRKNWQILYDGLATLPGLHVPKSLNLVDPKTTPWFFFFYHDNSEKLISALQQAGIGAAYWPALSREILVDPQWQTEKKMFNRSVTLPVHQDLSERQLRYLISQVNKHA